MKLEVPKMVLLVYVLMILTCLSACGVDRREGKTDLNIKPEMIIGTYGTPPLLQEYVGAYNMANRNYNIIIKDYSKNGQVDFNEAWIEMIKDLSGTHSIDMINISNGGLIRLINSGFIEELSTYYERDFSEDDFVDSLYKTLIINNQIYTVCPFFKVSALVIKERALSNMEDVSAKSFYNLINEYKDRMLIIDNLSRKDMLELLLENSLSEFIDLENGESHFESESFSEIIKLCNTLPEDIKEYEWSDNDEKEIEQFREDKVLFISEDFCTPEDLKVAKEKAGEDIVVIGFPMNGECNPIVKTADINIAITSGCNNKEEAWTFAKGCLLSENQEISSLKKNSYIPIAKEAYNLMIKKAQEVEYYKDDNDNMVELPHRWIKGSGWEIKVNAVEKTEVDEFNEIIKNSKSNYNYYDEEIMKIILEETEAYFEQKKSLADVEKIIQSRVSIFIHENMIF